MYLQCYIKCLYLQLMLHKVLRISAYSACVFSRWNGWKFCFFVLEERSTPHWLFRLCLQHCVAVDFNDRLCDLTVSFSFDVEKVRLQAIPVEVNLYENTWILTLRSVFEEVCICLKCCFPRITVLLSEQLRSASVWQLSLPAACRFDSNTHLPAQRNRLKFVAVVLATTAKWV